MSRWLAAVALLGFTGCAFTLDGPDPDRPRNRVPTCDTSKGLVALDGVMATALGIVALGATSASEPAIALVPLGLGALYVGGAVSGNKAVDRCRAAMNDYTENYGNERMAVTDPDEDDRESRVDTNGRSRALPRSGQGDQRRQQVPPPYSYNGPQAQPQPPYADPRAQRPAAPVQTQPVQPQPPQQPPQPAQPAQPAQGKAKPVAAPADDEGDWTDFWREVP